MPGFDRRGPNGEGPRTGRNLGKCRPLDADVEDDSAAQEETEAKFGIGRGGLPRGGGRGFGGGRGMGRGGGFGRGRGAGGGGYGRGRR